MKQPKAKLLLVICIHFFFVIAHNYFCDNHNQLHNTEKFSWDWLSFQTWTVEYALHFLLFCFLIVFLIKSIKMITGMSRNSQNLIWKNYTWVYQHWKCICLKELCISTENAMFCAWTAGMYLQDYPNFSVERQLFGILLGNRHVIKLSINIGYKIWNQLKILSFYGFMIADVYIVFIKY